uniref:E3 ubiquitin-protein ligase CHFR-like n=1 Tax=Saccoglossus kowalevskii TaxID=10224 RepID=A0ABM0MGC4_SACKO|nr:PREDICTED: E3 ubiquitin-protein ligase CHFR-like [Saccoglossus kowalevskii]
MLISKNTRIKKIRFIYNLSVIVKIDAEEIERAKDVPVKVDEKEKDSQNSAVSMATGDSDARDQMEEVLLCGICQDILHDCISPYQGLGARLINAVGGVFGLGVARPPPTICRQCPGCVTTDATTTVTTTATTIALAETAAVVVTNTPGVTATASSTTDSKNQPSTSTGMAPDDPKPSTSTDDAGTTVPAGTTRTTPDGEVIPMVEPPPFTCDVGQVHLMCLCCKQPMPDRRTAAVTDPTIPTQQYFTFGKKCLISIINENHYESDIFKNYMNENNITVKDLLKQCLVKLDSGEYVCPGKNRYM